MGVATLYLIFEISLYINNEIIIRIKTSLNIDFSMSKKKGVAIISLINLVINLLNTKKTANGITANFKMGLIFTDFMFSKYKISE